MDHVPRSRSLLVSTLLFLGLLAIGASFLMLGNGWLARPPVLGIRHPIAAAAGSAGVLLCLASVALRRLGGGRNDS